MFRITGANLSTESDYRNAVSYVRETGRTSIYAIMRKFKVNALTAGRIIDRMEREKIVTAQSGGWKREVYKQQSEGANYVSRN